MPKIYQFKHFAPKEKFSRTVVINNLYSGMLYEIYFDSQNHFREHKFKATFINEVFSLQAIDRLKKSIDFITTKLDPYKNHLILIPSQNPQKVLLQISFEEKEDTSMDWLDIVQKYHLIKDIQLNGHTILTELPEESIEGYYHPNGTKDEVMNLLSVIYLIPIIQIELTLLPNQIEPINLKLEHTKKLKKLAITGVLQ